MDEALHAFRPRRRTAIEGVALREAWGRIPPGNLTAPTAPGPAGAEQADVSPGDVLAKGGRPLRAVDLGVLAAAGLTVVPVRARPEVAIVSIGAGLVPPETRPLSTGEQRDAAPPALTGLVHEGGGVPGRVATVAEDAGSVGPAVEAALDGPDLLVLCAGSTTARRLAVEIVDSLGEPGMWCGGLTIEPGSASFLAECRRVPVLGLAGGLLAAVAVFRLVGIPLLQLLGGCTTPPPSARARTALSREVPSTPGRVDVIQVRLREGLAEPLTGMPGPMSTLAAADGYVLVPAGSPGLRAGSEVEVELYR